MAWCHFVGLDLGQAQDFTALAVLERPFVNLNTPPTQRRPVNALRHLRRLPLGTPYPEVVQEILKLLRAPTLAGALLVVDQTGVGRPVVDMLADKLRNQVTARLLPITITGGHMVTMADPSSVHVPKKELISTLQVLLQTRRLQIARSLLDAPILIRELENYRIKITAARNEVFEPWREGQHDDLVLAVTLAAWAGEKGLPPLHALPEPPMPRRVIA
jgi:hypothetical protein